MELLGNQPTYHRSGTRKNGRHLPPRRLTISPSTEAVSSTARKPRALSAATTCPRDASNAATYEGARPGHRGKKNFLWLNILAGTNQPWLAQTPVSLGQPELPK